MNKIKLSYDGLSQRVFTGKPDESVKVNPGVTDVDAAMFVRVRDSKGSDLKRMLDAGVITVIGDADAAAEGGSGAAMSDLTVKEIKSMLENVQLAEQLDELEAEEVAGKNRSSALDAIAERRAELPGGGDDADAE